MIKTIVTFSPLTIILFITCQTNSTSGLSENKLSGINFNNQAKGGILLYP